MINHTKKVPHSNTEWILPKITKKKTAILKCEAKMVGERVLSYTRLAKCHRRFRDLLILAVQKKMLELTFYNLLFKQIYVCYYLFFVS